MIAWDTLLAFGTLSFVVIAIPGPSVLFIVGRALQHGRREALLSVVGNAGGFAVYAVLVAVGVGAIIAASAAAFTVLKIAGGLYLVFLGIQAVRHRRDGLDVRAADAGSAPAASSRRVLAESFAVGVTNPKTLVFVAAVLPQFVDPAAGPAWAQILVLGTVFSLVAIVCDGTYALAAAGARGWCARSPRRISSVRATGGAMMAALGVALLVSRRAA